MEQEDKREIHIDCIVICSSRTLLRYADLAACRVFLHDAYSYIDIWGDKKGEKKMSKKEAELTKELEEMFARENEELDKSHEKTVETHEKIMQMIEAVSKK